VAVTTLSTPKISVSGSTDGTSTADVGAGGLRHQAEDWPDSRWHIKVRDFHCGAPKHFGVQTDR
jgi:hypothetical protein